MLLCLLETICREISCCKYRHSKGCTGRNLRHFYLFCLNIKKQMFAISDNSQGHFKINKLKDKVETNN